MNRKAKRGIIFIALAGLIGVSATVLLRSGSSQQALYKTAPVQRGDLQASISATGTVEPEEVVDVGAQVAGKIVMFGADQAGNAVDYGSIVEEGMVLARIDESLFSSDVARVKAELAQAKAGLQRAEADLGQLQARLVQAERDWNRAKKLGPSDALSKSDYDAALSAYEVAKANVAVGKATIVQAHSTVAEAEANLARALQNLDYTTIRSPVRGVIIDRRVNIGQTVVASLNAPSLFLIAKDLRRMQVWVAVNEADIGRITPGQPVEFTVDAYPGENFQGEVGKIRLNATMTQNVVTYTVEVLTDNSNGRLLPYLTANVKFLLNSRQNVLTVPNAALRWTPQPDQVAPESRRPAEERSRGRPAAGDAQAGQGYGHGVLWVPNGNYVSPMPVRVGMSDGVATEIESDQIKEGLQVVLGEQRKETAEPSQAASPFTPRIFGRGAR